MSLADKKTLVDPANDTISLRAQCRLIGLARSSHYYRNRPVPEEALHLMHRIDQIFTECPIFGARQIQYKLREEGLRVGRRRIRRIMLILGLEAIYKKPNTSKPNPEHQVYPYLLKEKIIDQPNQVWCADITYIPMKKGVLSSCHHGLGHTQGARAPLEQYDACGLLRWGSARCDGQIRHT